MSKTLKPPKGNIETISIFLDQLQEMVCRQDEHTGRQALTDDAKRAIMMDMCPVELERHLMLNSDRCDTYPKAMSGIRDKLEQRCRKTEPV